MYECLRSPPRQGCGARGRGMAWFALFVVRWAAPSLAMVRGDSLGAGANVSPRTGGLVHASLSGKAWRWESRHCLKCLPGAWVNPALWNPGGFKVCPRRILLGTQSTPTEMWRPCAPVAFDGAMYLLFWFIGDRCQCGAIRATSPAAKGSACNCACTILRYSREYSDYAWNSPSPCRIVPSPLARCDVHR